MTLCHADSDCCLKNEGPRRKLGKAVASEGGEKAVNCEFSLRHYEEILQAALARGYSFVPFTAGTIPERGAIFLRHDIDLSLDRALVIAECEAAIGVNSTYFFQPNSPLYNPFEERYLNILKRIAALGHTLGLHLIESCGDSARETCDTWHKRLGDLLPLSRVVSFHRPSQFLGKDVPGYTSTYENRFFRRIAYYSDSRKRWRDGCICNLLESYRESLLPSMQLLLHPIWWPETVEDSDATFRSVLQRRELDCVKYMVEMEPFRGMKVERAMGGCHARHEIG